MLENKITSLQHPLVLYWTTLRKEKAAREEAGSLLIAGKTLIQDLSQKIPIQSLISLEPTPEISAKKKFLVTEDILKKITGLESPGPLAAEVALPKPQVIKNSQRILILDQISDPGNLGTLIRTAHAFGWDRVIATPGTVDFFNDKALRASRGAIFYLPYSWQTKEEIEELIQENSLDLFIADTKGKSLDQLSFEKPCALVLSNEAGGPRVWHSNSCKMTIPMCEEAESLNVASAGAILLYTMRPL
jgi:TrmH family RNA methyltransferase